MDSARLRQCEFSNRRWYVDQRGERIGYVSERRDGFNAQKCFSDGVFQVVWNDAREDGLWPSLNRAFRAVVEAVERGNL